MTREIRRLLLLVAVLLAAPTASHARVLASAGPTFVSNDGQLNAGLDIGTGFEVGDPVGFSLRADLHGIRRDHGSWHATTVLACMRVKLASSDAPARPYLLAGAGYGTALSYSDFVLPGAATLAAGVEIAGQGGSAWFLEVGTSWAKESQMTAIRLGASLR